MNALNLIKGVLFAAVLILLLITPTVVFGVNCDKNPSHKNCTGEPPPDDGDSGKPVEAVFHVDITGVFTTFFPDGQDSRPQSVKNGSKSVIFSPRQTKPMSFMMTDFWTHEDRDYVGGSLGSNCFGNLIYTELNGSLHLNEFEGSQISLAVFWFKGWDDGSQTTPTEIKYVLELHDSYQNGWSEDLDPYQFPPGSDPLTFSPTTWEMRTEGGGELNKGPCIGTGTFDSTNKIEFSLYRK